MSVFAVQYTYVDDSPALDEHRPAHREFLRDLADQGICLLAGAYPGQEDLPAAALLLFEGESAEAVTALLAQDPFQLEGLVASSVVRLWSPPLGSWIAGDDAPLTGRF
ncbi:MAG: YciI family protein [Micrococcus sp.]|nr:YciI family protein [Micrococcus sp.]